MEGLRPYLQYRDSGHSWLGPVPRHWECTPLRRVAKVQLSNVDKHTVDGEVAIHLCNYTDVYRRRLITPDIDYMKASALPREIEKFHLRKGDVIITKDSEMWTDIAVPAYVTADMPGVICGYHLAQIRPHSEALEGGYLFWSFQAEPVVYQFRVSATGVTRFSLSRNNIASGVLTLPPKTEQDAIIAFLTNADRRINRLIRAKRRLIEMLNEQKLAIISQAVTRGLDLKVRLKPSGIEWLGDVPEHWVVSRLDHFIALQRGFDITKEQQVDGPIPVVSSGGISSYHNQRSSKGPGVLVGRKGTVGSVHFVQTDYWAHDTTLWVKEFDGNDPKFVYYVLKNLDLKRFDTGSANPTLNRNVVHPEQVPFAPVDEQRAIASFLDHKLEQIDDLIRCSSRQIGFLAEYRSRLIADVVTGKLDVRGVDLPALDQDEAPEEAGRGYDVEPAEIDYPGERRWR